jgi:3-deoxy-7-phosphoheptulonate synthase
VLLKRGFGCTVEEWLGAAEYVLHEGNGNVALCERGIRTFEGSTRFTLDLAAVAVVKQRSHLPVIVDPSHGTGSRWLTTPLALAAAAVGADGVIVDVHTNAAAAMCDGAQALSRQEFHALMVRLRPVLSALARPLAAHTRAQAA